MKSENLDSRRSAFVHLVAWIACVASTFAAPPITPTIVSPPSDGAIVNAADVHMETGPFSDPDAGNTHSNTDWQVWTVGTGSNIVWIESAAIGTDRLHTHLGEGTYTNSLAGKAALNYDTDYRLLVRHRDNTSTASAFAERPFHTAPPTQILPLLLEDAASSPTPTFQDSLNANVILPPGGVMRVESTNAELIVEFTGTNNVSNPAPLPTDRVARVKATAVGAIPASTIALTDGHGDDHTIYLPAMSVALGSNAFFAISANGSTYYGSDFSNLARGAPVPWSVDQPGFQVDVVATGFQLPIGIAFVPNPGSQTNSPYFYVAELYGNIKVVTRDGTVRDYATNLLNFNPTASFPGSGELGLCGIFVEPSTGDVLASHVYSSIPGNDSANKYPKVVRFHSTNGGLSASSTNTVLDMAGEIQGPAHQVSHLSIGPDAKLYVHNGDGMNTANAQNLNSFQGKILRLNVSGTPASDNPFFNGANGTNAADYVYAYGFRNPFGGDWRASDGFRYEVENGPNVDRFARVVNGRNYLWDGSNESMTNYAIYNWSGATAPVHVQFMQSSVFGGSGFPSNKFDHAFVTESGATYATGPQATGKRVSEFVIDGAGNLVSGPDTLISYSGSGKATAAGMAVGPDGLYFTDLYQDSGTVATNRGANVLRIKFVGTADFVGNVTSGRKPLTVQFTDTSNVTSPTNWQWDFGDGGTSTNRNPSHLYANAGSYNVRLLVTGANGASVVQKNGYITVQSVITESGGVSILEAEDFTTNISPRSLHSWVQNSGIAGFSGPGYMEALPDNNSNINVNVQTTSPELQYTIDFSTTGTRFVWLRGHAPNADGDSVHGGLDGTISGAASNTFENLFNMWAWTNRTMAGNASTITVGSSGTHTFSLWMREDGLRLDRVLLTTNANFQATLGNVFHIPNNSQADLANAGFPTMRYPLKDIPAGVPVKLFTGNQFQGGAAAGNQLQTGSTIFFKRATEPTWSSIPMFFFLTGTANPNNKYYSNSVPAGTFSAGDTVQYYFMIPYDDHLPTFIYGNDGARSNSEIESVALADPFSYTVQWPLAASGGYLAFTNVASGAEARIYTNSGHIALGTNVTFAPPAVTVGGESHNIGRVLSSSALGNGWQIVQQLSTTSVVARLTFPYDGVMRYEVVDWGGLPVDATSVTASSDASEHFYGFGEKFNDFDQAGRKTRIITDDPPGTKGDKSYKVAPWFISTKGYGFHLDSSAESWFDMRAQFADRYVVSNMFSTLKFNVVAGPKLTDVLTRYTGYTGRPQMSPPWAFAPWMSSDIWRDGGEVRYLITKYRERGIPGSVLVFDSPWEVSYNDFTWNTNQWKVGNTYEGTFYSGFNTTADMMTFLRTNGFYVVCWMTPFINTSSNNEGIPGQNTGQSPNYAEGSASNYFVRASTGGSPLVVNWWKGTGSPVDYTNPNAVLWAQKQLSNLVAQSSSGGFNVIGGFKTDDGESGNPPGSYIPATAVYFDGRTGVEMQNGYSAEYHKAIWNVLGTNGLLFARSGFTGSHAYPGYWAGDNEPNFGQDNGLQSVVVAAQSAAMSGYSTWSSDIGGYQNSNVSSTPTNLFMRWTQFGAFSPLMQMHRQIGANNQYPWSYGAVALTNYQFYAKLHTALFPYIYSYAKEASTNGLPIMRPVVLLNQTDPNVYGLRHTFYFGNELYVSPVVTNTTTTRLVYLPQGRWYDFFTNTVYIGGQNIVWTNANQSIMPLFAREGAIIPMISTNVQTLCDAAYVSNPNIVTMDNALEFVVYPTTNSSFNVYDGTSAQCQSNGTVVTFNLTSTARPITLHIRGSAFGVERDGVRVPSVATAAEFNAASFVWRQDGTFVRVKFPHNGGSTQIRLGPDSVGDGISDSWRLTQFGSATTTNNASCASCDPDGDGLSNAQEYAAGTGPQDSSNLLRITTVQRSGNDVVLNFPTVLGRKYQVDYRDDMVAGMWDLLRTNIPGTDGPVSITDTNAASLTKRFYRTMLLP